VFEHNVEGLQGVSSSVAVHQYADVPFAETSEDPLLLVDWSNWGLQSLFPQDHGPMGNEFLSDWFH
jgi:hypothetical protein